jgi:hypothetical protein
MIILRGSSDSSVGRQFSNEGMSDRIEVAHRIHNNRASPAVFNAS